MAKRSVRSFEEFTQQVKDDPALQAELKNDPVQALKDLTYTPQQDPWLFRGVVYSLGLSILIIIGGIIALMFRNGGLKNDEVPTLLTALGSAAIGALAGLLAPSPRNS
ncbi:MAG: hypothetical protein JNL05_11990 [Flavobacteriales bacterium]|nr:hypothetical protein [Flavobacteriales bacterium]